MVQPQDDINPFQKKKHRKIFFYYKNLFVIWKLVLQD